jgi:hypothetical protein
MASDTHRPIVDPIFGNQTTAGVFPASSTKTGTITSTGTDVRGTGTLFLTEVRKGDYIWCQNQIRKVTVIYNNTRLTVNAAFAPDVAAQALKTVRQVPNIKLSISNVDSVTAYLGTLTADAQILEPGQSVNYTSDNGMGPIAYNPNGGTLNITNGEVNMSAEVTIVGAPNVNVLSVIPGTGATNLGKAEDAAHSTGDVGVMALGVRNDSTAQTSLTSNDGDYSPIATDIKGNSLIVGNVPHDAVDAGNPVKTGGRARTTDITAVATDDRVDSIHDKIGRQVIAPYSLPENFISGTSVDITGTTATDITAAPGASSIIYVTSLMVTNGHASVGTVVKIVEESSTTAIWRGYAASGGGGFTITFPIPIKTTTVNKKLQAICETTGASVQVSASGYKSA